MLRRQQQFPHGNLQSCRKPVQSFDRRVFNPALNPSDIGAVNTGVHRQCLLRQPAPHAKPPKIPSHQSRRLHRRKRRLCGPLKHGLYCPYFNIRFGLKRNMGGLWMNPFGDILGMPKRTRKLGRK